MNNWTNSSRRLWALPVAQRLQLRLQQVLRLCATLSLLLAIAFEVYGAMQRFQQGQDKSPKIVCAIALLLGSTLLL